MKVYTTEELEAMSLEEVEVALEKVRTIKAIPDAVLEAMARAYTDAELEAMTLEEVEAAAKRARR